MSESLDAATLAAPLGSKRFPADNLRERNWVLGEIVSGYAAEPLPADATERDKQLFILASYLHANSADAGLPDLPTELVTAMVVERASTLSFDARTVVARFLLAIAIRYEPHTKRRSEDPRPLLLAAIGCLLAATFVDVSAFTSRLAGDRGPLAHAVSESGVERWQRLARQLLSSEGRVAAAATDLQTLLEDRPAG